MQALVFELLQGRVVQIREVRERAVHGGFECVRHALVFGQRLVEHLAHGRFQRPIMHLIVVPESCSITA